MPQMAPLWWLTLMILFNVMMMMTMNLLYFNNSMNFKSEKILNKKKLHWKW